MSAICGRFQPGAAQSVTIMDSALAALFPAQGEPSLAQSATASVAALGEQASIAKRGPVLVALDGRPATGAARDCRLRADDLLDLYERSGESFITDLRGAFALAVVDDRRPGALLAVDRLGRRPLAWALGPQGTLTFGSTATAVRACGSEPASVDPQAILSYLYFHVIPSPQTVFSGIRKLEPAQQMACSPRGVEISRYWTPEFDDSRGRDVGTMQDEVRELVRDAVERSATSPATGAFLSGGIDSSTVSGMLRKLRGEPVKCFTIGFDSEGFDELQFARIAAEHFGNELIHYYVTPDDVVASLPEIAAVYDEPFGNASAVPALHCARLAREHGVELMLAGDGGDELFAGNERYRKQLAFNFYRAAPGPVRHIADRLADLSPGPGARGPRRLLFYLDKSRASLPRRLDLANFLYTHGYDAIFGRRFLDAVDTGQPARDLQDWYDAAPGGDALNQMLYLDWKLTLADNDLRKVNRMCEFAGMRVRYPLIDDGLVAFSTKLGADVLMPRLRLRHFFKESMRGFLPDAVLDKSKHGFGLPFGQWLLEHRGLARLVDEAIASLRERSLVRDDFIDWLRAAHRDQHASYYGVQIWLLVMLELWLQQHAPDTNWRQ